MHWQKPGNHLLRLQVHNFDRAAEFTLHFDVNESVFVGEEEQWLIDHFLVLLDALLDDAGQLLASPGLLSPDHEPFYQTSVGAWPVSRSIHEPRKIS